jgi:RNA polymerase sigma-70 factor (ECF subfamily)
LRHEQSAEIQMLMGQLDPDYRTPLILRYWENLSYEEIAATLDLTVPAVKSRLFRARQRMADLMRRREMATLPPASGNSSGRTAVSGVAASTAEPPRFLNMTTPGLQAR